MSNKPILVAVADPVLHPEAMHIAAATGRPIVDTCDPREIPRHLDRCAAVLVCAKVAHAIPKSTRARVFLVSPDPGPPDWKMAVVCQAEQAFLLPAQAPELLQTLGREDGAVDAGTVIGFVPAVGGAGASVLAAAVARIAAEYVSTVVIDADPESGGLDLVFGVEDVPGARWGDMQLGAHDIASNLLAALPATKDGIRVLSAARSNIVSVGSDSSEQYTAAITTFRGIAELTIVDCSPATIVELAPLLDLVVLVVPAQVRPTAAAARCAAQLKAKHVDIVAIGRHIQWSGLEPQDIERISGVPVLAELGTISRLPKLLDMQGLPMRIPRPMRQAAQAVLEVLR
ncbi:septum site-determining protein Ssd [Corynebacterium freiburgense]|uniref:septum site-determining protein Ssd n=1 Tax=Corynebacterium freiburgense TaxID=556548 RepID=UPI000421373B|nr:septum site-determining protein Ssd [Corynebacterium freiburgense]WJZ01480.1 hypothetical protein CFREI_00855 [Corynebacterium freiburgense]